MKSKNPFQFLGVPDRKAKPRKTGLTVVIDEGHNFDYLKGYLEAHHPIVDYMKNVHHAGTLVIDSAEHIKKRTDLYKSFGLESYPGGIPFHFAVLEKKVKEYFEVVKELGYTGVEIAEDGVPEPLMTRDERNEFIRLGCEMGLTIHTELGKKRPDKPLDLEETVREAKADLESGATTIAIERSDLGIWKDYNPYILYELVETMGLEPFLFETGPDGGWPDLAYWMVEVCGPEVNVSNIYPDQAIIVENMRLGVARHDLSALKKYYE